MPRSSYCWRGRRRCGNDTSGPRPRRLCSILVMPRLDRGIQGGRTPAQWQAALDPAAEPRGDRGHGVAAESVEAWAFGRLDGSAAQQRRRLLDPALALDPAGELDRGVDAGDLLGREGSELGEGPDPERVQPLLYLTA